MTERFIWAVAWRCQRPLFLFKAGFSPARHPFQTLRAVLRPQAYRRLVRASGRELGGPSGGLRYFPAYRSPDASSASSTLGPVPNGNAHLAIRQIVPDDSGTLAQLLAEIDQTHFRPHAMDAHGAAEIAAMRGRDLYLIGFLGSVPVAYGMLRGWDVGYPTPSLGIGIHPWVRATRTRALDDGGAPRQPRRPEALDRCGSECIRTIAEQQPSYEALGYRVAGTERGETLMILDL